MGVNPYAYWNEEDVPMIKAIREFNKKHHPDITYRPNSYMQGWFTGKRLGDYIGPSGDDFINARRVVNGLDDAELIANYARVFHRAVIAGDPLKPLPAPKPIQIGKKPVPAEELPPAKPGKVGSAGLARLGLFGALLAGALASIGAALGWW